MEGPLSHSRLHFHSSVAGAALSLSLLIHYGSVLIIIGNQLAQRCAKCWCSYCHLQFGPIGNHRFFFVSHILASFWADKIYHRAGALVKLLSTAALHPNETCCRFLCTFCRFSPLFNSRCLHKEIFLFLRERKRPILNNNGAAAASTSATRAHKQAIMGAILIWITIPAKVVAFK